MRLRPLTVARALAGVAVVARLAGRGRPVDPIRPATAPPGTSISVVVPARDEADRIGPLLDALRPAVDASAVAEVVVVDDESTDGTASTASAAGATVVTGRSRPPGWAGKTWALQQGVEAAAGEWIVTLDADTRPDARLPAALVARSIADGWDLLTVGGRFECPTPGVRWLHASMLTTLVYRFGPPGTSRPPAPDRQLANGQCTVFRRHDLLAGGGFEPVAGSVVEDVALARHLARAGRRVGFLDASELLTVRMFESLGDTWRGWGRSLGLPGVEPTWRRIADTMLLAVTMPVPLLRLVTGRADVVDGVLLAVRLGTVFGTRTAYDRNDVAYWTSPLADAVSVSALAVDLTRRRRTWKGRNYAAP